MYVRSLFGNQSESWCPRRLLNDRTEVSTFLVNDTLLPTTQVRTHFLLRPLTDKAESVRHGERSTANHGVST